MLDLEYRDPISCKSCGRSICDHLPYWNCQGLGAVCDICWPEQSKNHLREYRTPALSADHANAEGKP